MTKPGVNCYFCHSIEQLDLNLDGGGSATFWIYGNVMNSPCYGHERPMANALVLVQKPSNQNAALQSTAIRDSSPHPE